jgi:hypothetical protein
MKRRKSQMVNSAKWSELQRETFSQQIDHLLSDLDAWLLIRVIKSAATELDDVHKDALGAALAEFIGQLDTLKIIGEEKTGLDFLEAAVRGLDIYITERVTK